MPSKKVAWIQPIRLSLLTLLALMSLGSHANAADRPPNIVFIFADDLGFADLACYGHPYAKTPNIDKLATEGARFTQAYVTGTTCNPSRTGLMTGLYPARYQKYAANYGFGDRVTITELLNDAGYHTAHFGKWHIGPKETAVHGHYGIDKVEVMGGSTKDPQGRDARLFSSAEKHLRSLAGSDQPFYLNIWAHSTHFAVSSPPERADLFKNIAFNRGDFSPAIQDKFDLCEEIGGELKHCMKQYLGDVYGLDQCVGRLMKTLDELKLRENTIVIFSSDHGPAPILIGGKYGRREHAENMLGYAGIYRGGKHTHYEGGLRVPFIIRWPDKVEPGRLDEDSVINFIDWMPTLASIAGIADKLPDQLDGEDVSDIWLGVDRQRNKAMYWRASLGNGTPVMREGKWKLHLPVRPGAKPELYDLEADPAETVNLANTQTDVLKDLSIELRAWADELPGSYDKPERKTK